MSKLTFKYGDIQLEYKFLRESDSDKTCLCFHGFGRSLEDFEIFEKSLPKDMSVISFNLFQHGNSKIEDHRIWNRPLDKAEIKEYFEAFFKDHNIREIVLFGYSMGGKLCLILNELFPEISANLLLIAPDGIRISPIYKFSSRNKLGISLFRFIIRKPGAFFWLVNTGKRLKLITKSQHRVIMINLETYEKRKQVGETWYAFSRLDPDISLIKKQINEHGIPSSLFYGQYDKVIPLRQGKEFTRDLKESELVVIKQGHALMNKYVAGILKNVILQEK